jgi:DMSO/TMAO reductase YedYZ heme-binding membrane subunit
MAKWFYLFMAVLGFIIPNLIVWQIITQTGGFDVLKFLSDSNTNLASQFIAIDLAISATAGVGFIIIESHRQKIKYWWAALVGTALVGFSFGFPLFLYLRELSLENKSGF